MRVFVGPATGQVCTRQASTSGGGSEEPGRTHVGVGWLFLPAHGFSWAWLLLPPASTGGIVGSGDGWPTHLPALLGPLAAAFVVTARRTRGPGVRDLLARMARWWVPLRWWAFAVSPLLLLAVVLLVVNGLGEETGWRGYALPELQRRHSPLVSVLVVEALWAGWHAPMFLVVDTFRSFGVGILIGWLLGLPSVLARSGAGPVPRRPSAAWPAASSRGWCASWSRRR